MVVVGSGAALAATVPGTNAGEVLRGTDRADTISGYGGADLIYGYGGGDTVWGGNEAGKGDKALGGTGSDRLVGQQGEDALYGQGGADTLEGQYGADLIVGGAGGDTLYGGPGADEVDAQDGRRDVVDLTGSGANDLVYYDRGIDVFVNSSVESVGEGSSATEAARTTGAELSASKPPEELFAHTGKVLVEHRGEELLVVEKQVERHTPHGDEIIDPTGRGRAGALGFPAPWQASPEKGATAPSFAPARGTAGAARTHCRPRTYYNPLREAFSEGREAILLHGG
jgi:hypothetical protein